MDIWTQNRYLYILPEIHLNEFLILPLPFVRVGRHSESTLHIHADIVTPTILSRFFAHAPISIHLHLNIGA